MYREFSRQQGRRIYKYKNCGRKPWKVSRAIEKFILKRLLELRKLHVCTSTMLAREVMKRKRVELEDSTVRKVLKRNGYTWLPRNQKPKYSEGEMVRRKSFADGVLELTPAELRSKLSLAMDGVVVTVPPNDATARLNYCRYGDTHIYRKKNEAALPELAGADRYAKQVPLARSLPMWGGVSEGGFVPILFHPNKKLDSDEWVEAVENGCLDGAIKKLKPMSKRGPWTVLCDGESFLHCPESREAHRKVKVKLWQIPAKSPDLNPIDFFWAWMRRELRARDFADLRAKRAVLGKMAYKKRVVNVLRSAKAQRHAAACVRGLRKVCREVSLKGGAASRG